MKKYSGRDYRDVERGLNAIVADFPNAKHKKNRYTPFKNKNFITSNIVAVRRFPNGFWFELSYGTGFSSDYVYGVTIANDHKMLNDLSEGTAEFEEVREILKKVEGMKP
ncbi:MAG: hypothetical protein GY718_10720 [Lentisphaerae bacterium]|nr:hypothetical protein [Lentisphaerota bacterium]